MFVWLRLHHPASRANKYDANKYYYYEYDGADDRGIEFVLTLGAGARQRGGQPGLPLGFRK